jgi:hypothetical protein
MNVVVGLGKTGCAVAEQFSAYPQYEVYKIREGARKRAAKRVYTVREQASPEAHEEGCPSFKNFFKTVDGDVLFVVDGSENISAVSLRVLEQIKHCRITVLYIRPDLQFLKNDALLNERAVRGILQEYARSSVFERIYLIDVPLVAATLGDVPIKTYHERVYSAIVGALHMINIFSHADVVIGSSEDPLEFARISTFGFVEPESGKENLFFSLDFPREKSYYYAFNEEKLQTDGTLLNKVKEQVLEGAHENLKTSYAIYETQYDNDYIYITAHSSMSQA